MAGIYIHIPFCKQACHYCDFHFSTSLKHKTAMLQALKKELRLRKEELADEWIETIYFGGGTPSLLSLEELQSLLDEIYRNYSVIKSPEITLEANPDDLTNTKIRELSTIRINRLSIGIQSFFEEDLRMMNRAHSSEEAEQCLEEVMQYFKNISVDLIYGIPGMTNERWQENINKVLWYNIPHISCYALTVEPKTALKHLINIGKVQPIDEVLAQQHFSILTAKLQKSGYVHYELSNFGKEGFFSANNTAYWLGKKYMGIGPSAHSYDGNCRSWNVANNTKYIRALSEGLFSSEKEELTLTDQYNEYVMTGLRTMWGVSLNKIKNDFGVNYYQHFVKCISKYIRTELLIMNEEVITVTDKGKFLCDGIAADLFFVD
ncbi:radical SAM family heme chaperone HemW [Leptobacterium sp. I13]|uniref:radical SAM family heme chaperone HemW n=1 Tax=Leptobacterium meishanense TaxID=3128904 RepID=UPI0030ED20CC